MLGLGLCKSISYEGKKWYFKGKKMEKLKQEGGKSKAGRWKNLGRKVKKLRQESGNGVDFEDLGILVFFVGGDGCDDLLNG